LDEKLVMRKSVIVADDFLAGATDDQKALYELLIEAREKY